MILHASGPTPEALFEDAAQVVGKSLTNLADVGQTLREKLTLQASTLDVLLQDFVQSLLELAQKEKIIFCQVQIRGLRKDENNSFFIIIEGLGELIDPQRHELKTPLAELSCQKIVLQQTPTSFQAQIQIK